MYTYKLNLKLINIFNYLKINNYYFYSYNYQFFNIYDLIIQNY